jgi:hypothetical protein
MPVPVWDTDCSVISVNPWTRCEVAREKETSIPTKKRNFTMRFMIVLLKDYKPNLKTKNPTSQMGPGSYHDIFLQPQVAINAELILQKIRDFQQYFRSFNFQFTCV